MIKKKMNSFSGGLMHLEMLKWKSASASRNAEKENKAASQNAENEKSCISKCYYTGKSASASGNAEKENKAASRNAIIGGNLHLHLSK